MRTAQRPRKHASERRRLFSCASTVTARPHSNSSTATEQTRERNGDNDSTAAGRASRVQALQAAVRA
eukprot:3879720-Pleurochrysis_carterae.AAC.1